MTIAQTFSSALTVGILLLASVGKSEDGAPFTHPETITIRILDGKRGASLAHVHLQFVAGYDNADLRRGLWSAETITDGHGRADLPASIKDFPFVAVWVTKHKLCAAHGRSFGLSVDRIRYQGLSTPNYCGTAVAEDTPGVLNVFAKARGQKQSPPRTSPCRKRKAH